MSFQGDVAGLGLGELLQGLARGGREGVLNLRGGGLSARLGVVEGQLMLLPEEEEDPEIWRRRCERAWVKDPDHRIDTLRMREIAHAARLEVMFSLLDCDGVHFRFEPGPLPDLSQPARRQDPEPGEQLGRMETGAALEYLAPVTSPAVSVEYILLEHARLSDELSAHPQAHLLSAHYVPRKLGEEAPQRNFERLWSECDGMSSTSELADRLGWPLRQVRGLICDLLARGALRIADAREMLALSQRELQSGNFTRAASRLSGWCRLSLPGPASPGDAQLLLSEWEKGKLAAAVAGMEHADARTLLRRLDLAYPDATAAVARWLELRQHHRHDLIAELRILHWQHRSQNEADAPTMPELLRSARRFQELGRPWRAGIVLRVAASRGPEAIAVRLEIGQRMMTVGLTEEGASWVIDACRSLIAAGTPDRAVPALKQLLQLAPSHREARALVQAALGKTVTGKRVRRNSLVGLASVLVISLAAVVKVQINTARALKLAAVHEQSGDPALALRTLESHFGSEGLDEELETLRSELRARIESRQIGDRQMWVANFQECQLECTSGDPLLGLRRALELPPPPEASQTAGEALPKLTNLLDGLLARFEQTLAEWGPPTVLTLDQSHSEQRMLRLVDELMSVASTANARPELNDFQAKLQSLRLTLLTRAEQRATERERVLRAERIERIDGLLASARAHAAAGDLARAVDTYAQLAATPGSEKIVELLQAEMGAVRSHHQALLDALELATQGRHGEALARLSLACERPSEHLLPCRIESLPSGARVRFPDGSSRTTPFVLEAAPGERISAQFEHEGFDTTPYLQTDPADRLVLLSRTPSVTWPSRTRVEAVPVSVDGDHVVCDREGRIARIDPRGQVVWSAKLRSPMGIKHAPVFLPKRAGSLLLIDEDGEVWIVDASDGRMEGPLQTKAPPLGGPEPTANGVRARLVDGRELLWSARLKPDQETRFDLRSEDLSTRGHDAGLALRRRSVNESNELTSPWGQGQLEVRDEHFVLRRAASSEIVFGVARSGEWSYVAFEAPSARSPRGRLWLSDGAGLRAFEL